LKHSKNALGEDEMPRIKVGVHFCIDPELLAKINENIHGKNQSEKIRRLLGFGYEVFTLLPIKRRKGD
jgi:uncharacterized protein (UPF0216 family)